MTAQADFETRVAALAARMELPTPHTAKLASEVAQRGVSVYAHHLVSDAALLEKLGAIRQAKPQLFDPAATFNGPLDHLEPGFVRHLGALASSFPSWPAQKRLTVYEQWKHRNTAAKVPSAIDQMKIRQGNDTVDVSRLSPAAKLAFAHEMKMRGQ